MSERSGRGGTITLDYIVDLSRKNSEAIGFIPRPKLEKYIESSQVAVELENGDPCGFLVWGSGWPILRIYQTCIQYDARKLEHGAALVAKIESVAAKRGCSAVSLWCASDLDANSFWSAMGYRMAGEKNGGSKRGRQLIRWQKLLPDPLQPELLTVEEA